MNLSADELAGIVDLFGALKRTELQDGAAELAFKRDGKFEPDAFEADVADAVRSYHLLAVDDAAVSDGQTVGGSPATAEDGADSQGDDGNGIAGDAGVAADLNDDTWLVAGPIAFPSLPTGASDLPHILDVSVRTVNRTAVGRSAEKRFRRDAAAAAGSGDDGRIAELLDVSYELESWAPVDLAQARDRLDAANG